MTSFHDAFTKTVIQHEGGYANHPADRGGETFYGIARRYHHGWPGWPVLDSYSLEQKQKLRIWRDSTGVFCSDNAELLDLVMLFYRENFWNRLNLHSAIIPQALAEAVFDCAVHMGTVRAGRFLQHALNQISNGLLIEDGVVGNRTLGAINNADAGGLIPDVIRMITILRGGYLYDQTQRVPEQRVFLRGWLRRILP